MYYRIIKDVDDYGSDVYIVQYTDSEYTNTDNWKTLHNNSHKTLEDAEDFLDFEMADDDTLIDFYFD
jgi:hypothetical protein